jgi:hypothetical protein
MKIGEMTSDAPAHLNVPMPQGTDAVAVIVQHGRVGPVLGAAKLRY